MKATCPFCFKDVRLISDGTFARHLRPRAGGGAIGCTGGGTKPRSAEMTAALKALDVARQALLKVVL